MVPRYLKGNYPFLIPKNTTDQGFSLPININREENFRFPKIHSLVSKTLVSLKYFSDRTTRSFRSPKTKKYVIHIHHMGKLISVLKRKWRKLSLPSGPRKKVYKQLSHDDIKVGGQRITLPNSPNTSKESG